MDTPRCLSKHGTYLRLLEALEPTVYEGISWRVGDACSVCSCWAMLGFPLRNTIETLVAMIIQVGQGVHKQKDIFKSAPFLIEKNRSVGGELQGSLYYQLQTRHVINHSKLAYLKLTFSLLKIGLPKRKAESSLVTIDFQVLCHFQEGYHASTLDHFLNHLYI